MTEKTPLRITKGDFIEDTLKTSPTLDKDTIKRELKKYFIKTLKDTRYFLLNSRKINYNTFFDTEGATVNEVVDHVIDYLDNSSFVCTEDETQEPLIPISNLQHHKMSDIKDIDIESDEQALGIYIDGIYFKLIQADWMIERTQDFK